MATEMTAELDPQQFAELRQHFQAICELPLQVQSERIAAVRLAHPTLAQALADLLAALDPADLQADEHAGLLQGQQFGPFKVLRPLGSGGMGEVFLAERCEQGFEQRVALKRVHRLARSAESTRRFLRERQLLARLDHPGIARLIDGGVAADGRPWLAMEYVDGQSLQEHARQRGLDARGKVALFRGVCAAVAYAHRNLIVHRDIKPANVLVTAEGKTKLLDFGVARLLDDSDAELTRRGARLLTLRYAAPEQVAGDRSTTATDVYALGVLLFELLTGGSPYQGAAISGDWGQAALGEAPRPLLRALDGGGAMDWRRQRRQLAELDRVLRKAMAKVPGERYPGVLALDADLEDWLAGRPLRSGIGGARAQSVYLLRRLRWPLGLAAATVIALGVGLVLARQQALSAGREARAAQAHLEAVLDVLGAANPGHFAGREPTASEFLLTAARQIDRAHADRPALRRRALLEVGHGLLNLGKSREAEEVLQRALHAAEQDPLAGPPARLAVLGLLVEAQDDAASQPAQARTVASIESLLRESPPSTAGAVEASTRAAAARARQGDFAAAERLFDLAEARLDSTQGSATERENLWRQRGWAALRANQAEAASRYLREADRTIQAAAAEFGELRRAEGHLLQAQAALLGGQADQARQRVEAARLAYAAEYGPEHPEAAVFRLHEAQVLLLEGRSSESQALAARVIERLRREPGGYQRDLATAGLVQAAALAGQRKCAAARVALASAAAQIDALQPLLPRERARQLEASQAVLAACGVDAEAS
jgi:serine/threonine-protein kinase